MNYPNKYFFNKKIIFIFYCSLALGMANAQQVLTFDYTGGSQTWTVPSCVSSITITAIGGGGGSNNLFGAQGGYGATIEGAVPVQVGDVINIYVGGQGTSNTSYDAGAGGGGSFIWDATSSALLEVAGGGGGCYYDGPNGYDASVTTSPTGQNGGSGESGGNAVAYDAGGGGAGFLGDGGSNSYGYAGYGGSDFSNGFAGGAGDAYYDNIIVGGYGGGGGAGYDDGGGGGGYNGGGSGNEDGGGGGGSYVNGSLISSSTVNSGNGSVTIIYSTVPLISGNAITNVLCNGGSNGSASAIVNGVSPYIYSWAPAGQTTDTITGLSAGVYTVTVMEACGGSATATVTITQPASAVSVSAGVINNVLCSGGNSGSASSFTSGGASPYTYSWTPAGGTARNATGLSAGTYTLSVTDNHGCTASASTTITQPNALIVSANVTANVLCNGGANGSIASSVTYGTMPYTYLWSDGGTMDTATWLTAGTYSLKVIDNNGCTGSASVTITQPTPLNISADIVTDVTCYGGNNGGASSNASGGTLPYNYFWSDGETNAIETGLTAGTYTVTATDYCGSSVTTVVTITQPAAVGGSVTIVQNIICNGGDNGCASVSASGGAAPYSYQWSDVNNQTTVTVCGLSAGTYTVNIVDNNGCMGEVFATITQPAPMNVFTNSTVDNGNCTGSASVTVNGGVTPYTYSWVDGNMTNTISGQCAGTYCCTITDSIGCAKEVCVSIPSSTTGIASLAGGKQGVTAYPNPNNGQFTIQSSVVSGQWSVEVYNVLGEEVYATFNIHNPTWNINLSNQPDGIYLYRVMTESGNLLGEGKIMLQK